MADWFKGIASDWTLVDYLASIHAGLASYYNADDMYIGNYVGALYQINTGSTTIVDWCHNNPTPDHTDEAIRGLEESKIRAIFLHGSRNMNLKKVSHILVKYRIQKMKSKD